MLFVQEVQPIFLYYNHLQGFLDIQCVYDRDRSLDVENAIKKAAEDDGFVTYQVTKASFIATLTALSRRSKLNLRYHLSFHYGFGSEGKF